MEPLKILIACGGSGGHIFPGIALAEALADLNKRCRICIVTSDRRIDTQIFKEENFPYFILPYNRLPDSLNPLKIVTFLVNLIKAVARSLRIVRSSNPDCVVGLGGYVSGPIAFTAWLMRKPLLIHEQNMVPSLTNRLSAVFADRICVTFEETGSYFKARPVTRTGNPVRLGFLKGYSGLPHQELGLDRARFTILIMGGSQGSSFLNDSLRKAISEMDHDRKIKLQILHIAGAKDASSLKDYYRASGVSALVWPFLDKMGPAYEASDLIISRAGATALSEITAFGKPSILIPYPKPRIHQKENAEFFCERGASLYVEEKKLAPGYLKDIILTLIEDPDRLRQMADRARALGDKDAAYRLARETLSYC